MPIQNHWEFIYFAAKLSLLLPIRLFLEVAIKISANNVLWSINFNTGSINDRKSNYIERQQHKCMEKYYIRAHREVIVLHSEQCMCVFLPSHKINSSTSYCSIDLP